MKGEVERSHAQQENQSAFMMQTTAEVISKHALPVQSRPLSASLHSMSIYRLAILFSNVEQGRTRRRSSV